MLIASLVSILDGEKLYWCYKGLQSRKTYMFIRPRPWVA